MHVVQLALVDLEGVDITDINMVTQHTEMSISNEEQEQTWWDWFAIGGRWSDYLQEVIGPMVWPNNLDSPVALKLNKDNWPMAIKLLEKIIEYKAKALIEYVDTLKETGVDLNKYILELDTDIYDWKIPYVIRNIFALKCGDWTCDSAYVDTTNWMSSSPEHLLKYLKDPENAKDKWDGRIEHLALVVVDFHC